MKCTPWYTKAGILYSSLCLKTYPFLSNQISLSTFLTIKNQINKNITYSTNMWKKVRINMGIYLFNSTNKLVIYTLYIML